MIRDFLIWWGRQLLSLLPARFSGNNATDADAVFISPIGDFGKETIAPLAMSVRRHGKISQHGQFPCDSNGLKRLFRQLSTGTPSQVLLALPQGVLLDKTVVLPAAVEPDLDRVLRYEMDVETPFTADQVYWNWAIHRRDRTAGKIVVTLTLLPQARLSGLLTLLRQHGIAPQGIVAPRGDGTAVVLPLVRVGKAERRSLWLQPRTVWSLCLFLTLTVIALPFLRQSLTGRNIDARIAAVRAGATEAQMLLSRLDGTAGGGDVIMRERNHFSDPLQVLANLTDALPDDTYISDFLLKGHKLTVTGQSPSATRLIALLATNALFHDPSFASPVTRSGPDGGALELFSITAEVRSAP